MKVNGLIARKLIHRLADGEAGNESDLLSYLLFDGDFCGRADRPRTPRCCEESRRARVAVRCFEYTCQRPAVVAESIGAKD